MKSPEAVKIGCFHTRAAGQIAVSGVAPQVVIREPDGEHFKTQIIPLPPAPLDEIEEWVSACRQAGAWNPLNRLDDTIGSSQFSNFFRQMRAHLERCALKGE